MLVSRPVPEGRPPEDIAAAAVPPAAAREACERVAARPAEATPSEKASREKPQEAPSRCNYSGGAGVARGLGAGGAGGGSGRVGALPPRLRVPFAGANWSRWRNGHPKAAVRRSGVWTTRTSFLPTSSGGGYASKIKVRVGPYPLRFLRLRRSEVTAPNVNRGPACGGRAGPVRSAPPLGCVSLTAKPARR